MSVIRLRRHTDGRLAVFRDGMWLITSVPPATSYPSWFHDDRLCSGPGWSELLVAALPEPDVWDGTIPAWHTSTSYVAAEGSSVTENSMRRPAAKSDALKMLAAVAACEQYRAQREATAT